MILPQHSFPILVGLLCFFFLKFLGPLVCCGEGKKNNESASCLFSLPLTPTSSTSHYSLPILFLYYKKKCALDHVTTLPIAQKIFVKKPYSSLAWLLHLRRLSFTWQHF